MLGHQEKEQHNTNFREKSDRGSLLHGKFQEYIPLGLVCNVLNMFENIEETYPVGLCTVEVRTFVLKIEMVKRQPAFQ